MTRQQQIEVLKHYIKLTTPANRIKDEMDAIVQRRTDTAKQWLVELEHEGWIDVGSQLPPRTLPHLHCSDVVRVKSNSAETKAVYDHEDGIWFSETTHLPLNDVTHWREIELPPATE